MQIARQQRKEIDALRECLTSIEETVGRGSREVFAGYRARLDAWAARVAVIGQVKAGKSSFLNAFLGQSDLLPSDVNPWTSVITNVRVNIHGDPAGGARFDFFDEAAWDEIVDGRSDVRQLTEQLLPGFDTGLLRQQTEAMKARAQERLGRYYPSLLGSHHAYDILTPELLQRYVCAGDADGEPGRYAAITREANLYLRRPDFAVPTIVTDTPGVNDPFLVRDEFTCRSLDASDVFIVVLSAHQALTEVDIALMRILARQKDKDVIVFVNRIDELDDYDTDVPRVLGDVTRRLRAAIPEVEFTILAGSAWFADLALRDDDEAALMREALDDAALHAYLRDTFGHVPADERDRFRLASGLDEVKQNLSMVIDHGIGSQQVARLLADVRAEIAGVIAATRRERDSVQVQVQRISGDNAGAGVAALEAELAQLQAARLRLESTCDAADHDIGALLGQTRAGLEEALNGAIAAFLADTRCDLEARLAGAAAGQVPTRLDLDLAPLRERLESTIAERFADGRDTLDRMLGNWLDECQSLIAPLFAGDAPAVTLDALPQAAFASTLTLVRQRLELGVVNARTWAFWRQRRIDLDRTLDALRQIAAAELRPAMLKLMTAFDAALSERAQAGQDRLQVLQRMMDTASDERSERLRSDRARIEQLGRDPEALRRMVHRLQGQMEVLERRIQYLAINDSHLGKTTLARAA
ncbi:MAG: dynamin family protein [Pseudooceanicola sp.]|nr:dynamin family protein [Pseudooceanicola sp.]